ncbi:YihY/virulence factor BrkB family protein [Dolichospermum sp. ST_con]|nr:YihY/virulence factor BrkB family protein [Dolichospermum sp. ST_con]MDD1419679.1 YihY/virulence factor BrkB family protein [Dolichospermum sp. ST_sed1]MDD1423655.1 YihY/virulence factor BrkB family protein [Dolichospermum sp. ST_sed9]MDD1429595.1 YihY/virulence factor BrkB family protein [Dolichospermum sp. ST_sed6]MDD1435008.1 YihY/virulence factor BrkB family protein [Dolichospermum sp. ST_sed10]MDD1440482.1 YihY/virulence factor BrkB family protein [Dolichospermum sp. ST_sed3]MDD144665
MLQPSFFRFFRHLTWRTLKKTFARTIETRLLGLAAEIAFNAMLSLFPAILALLTAIGLFAESLRNTFIQLAIELSKIVPQEAWILIRDFATHEIANSKNSSLFSLSFVLTLWAASGAISTAMTALDRIQQLHPKKMRSFWHAKLISLGLTIGTILLLVVASFLVFISDLLLGIVVKDNTYFLFLFHIWQFLLWPLALGTVATAFAFVYRYGPSKWKANTPIIPGAILAAILWAIVSALFRLYVSNFGNYNKVYGAVGAVIVLMLWLWMSSFMLLLGQQLNVTVGEEMKNLEFRI